MSADQMVGAYGQPTIYHTNREADHTLLKEEAFEKRRQRQVALDSISPPIRQTYEWFLQQRYPSLAGEALEEAIWELHEYEQENGSELYGEDDPTSSKRVTLDQSRNSVRPLGLSDRPQETHSPIESARRPPHGGASGEILRTPSNMSSELSTLPSGEISRTPSNMSSESDSKQSTSPRYEGTEQPQGTGLEFEFPGSRGQQLNFPISEIQNPEVQQQNQKALLKASIAKMRENSQRRREQSG
jgi:hypothetical protein